jgi:hypothetical protein
MNRLALPGCVALLATSRAATCHLAGSRVGGWRRTPSAGLIELRGHSTFVMTGSFTGTGTL